MSQIENAPPVLPPRSSPAHEHHHSTTHAKAKASHSKHHHQHHGKHSQPTEHKKSDTQAVAQSEKKQKPSSKRDPQNMTQPDVDKRLKKLHRRAKLLDSQFSCFCGLLRFGLDSLIGLIPVIGDFAGVFLAVTYMNTIRRQFDIPATLASQMTLNIAIDFAVGLVPLLGDIVDTMFKANMRNYRIVEEYVVASRASASLRATEEGHAGHHHSKRDYLPKVPLRNAEHMTKALANNSRK